MPQAAFLRVVNFRPGSAPPAIDADLRDQVLPRLLDLDAIVDAWAGRRGSGEEQDRVLASTWRTDPRIGPDGPVDEAALAALGDEVAAIDAVEQLAISVHARFERDEPTRILRLFRGRVRSGELDPYIEAVRVGMLADSVHNAGLIALALGAEPPDTFTTVSVWTGWSAIEMATGGNIHQPFATRNSERLVSFTITHFEVLPDARDRGPDRD